MNITIHPVYTCHRPSRTQLWGVYVNNVIFLITRSYPHWVWKS